jgi:ABC-type nitrate/sulfonate/bicarbonate transport system substrate-binding protein
VSEPQIVSRFRSTFSLVIVVVSLVCLGASLSSAVAQEKTKVRAAYVPVATWLPLWVAQDMGAFEKNGLDVSLTSFRSLRCCRRRSASSSTSLRPLRRIC